MEKNELKTALEEMGANDTQSMIEALEDGAVLAQIERRAVGDNFQAVVEELHSDLIEARDAKSKKAEKAIRALHRLVDEMVNVSTMQEELELESFAEQYPFEKSFDEVTEEVRHWANNLIEELNWM